MAATGSYSIARITFANPLSVWARRMAEPILRVHNSARDIQLLLWGSERKDQR